MVTAQTNRNQPLSPGKRRLVNLMHRMNFGTIEDLAVRDGEPHFDPPPRVLRARKFGAGSTSPEPDGSLFTLKAPVAELLSELEAMRDGTVRTLEVQHGLPFRMIVEDKA